MGRIRTDYTGMVYGLLTVVDLNMTLTQLSKRGVWNCLCKCGRTITKSSSDLGKCVDSSSCGCYVKPIVNIVNHTVVRPNATEIGSYSTWEAMRQRCLNKNHSAYSYYGGRGITICEDWGDFWEFYADMGDRPDGMSLDRVNPDEGYSKGNCRWTTRCEQSYNTRIQTNNTSGKTGVIWSKREKRWVARIHKDGLQIRLGAFTDKNEAIKMREQAEVLYYGYNKN